MAEEDDEKTEEPSQYRIDEFKAKGDVASSKEVVNILVLFGTIVTIVLSSVYLMETLLNFFNWLIQLYPEAAFTDKVFKIIIWESFITMFKCILPVFAAAFCISILSQLVQIGFIFSTEALAVNFERINPIAGVKRLFSMKAIIEAIKGVFKFIIILTITYTIMNQEIPSFSGFLQVDFVESFFLGKTIIIKLVLSILAGLLIVALGDFFWEKFQYSQKLKQTKQQLKQETKEKEGNPEIKQRIRSIQREMSRKKMVADIPKADVIVSNPTHISIAIKYNSENMIAPIVVAKGADHFAMRIREIAKKNNVPIVENISLARTLYKTVKVGEAVPRPLYKAVAEILAFVFKLKKKQKALI